MTRGSYLREVARPARLEPASVAGRVPPHDLDAEAAVISAVLLSRDALDRVRDLIKPEHFYSEANGRIFDAAEQLAAVGSPIDIVSVASYLRDREKLAQVGGAAYLAQLVDATPAVAHVQAHAAVVYEKWRARRLIATCQATAAKGYGDIGDTQEFIGEHRAEIEKLTAGSPQRVKPTLDDPLRDLPRLRSSAVMGRAALIALAAEPILYVWESIAVTGTIVLLAGGPASGKTTLLFLILVARANLGAPVDVLRRRVQPAPAGQFVVLVEGEHGGGSTARKLVRSCVRLGVGESAMERMIVVARKAVRIGDPTWTEIELLVAGGLVSDIALDTLGRVAPGDANDEQAQVAIFDRVAATIERAPPGAAPTAWVVAHTRKDPTGSLDDVSGSAQRTGQADSVLILRAERVGGQVVSTTAMFPKLREEPEEYPTPISFAIVGDELRIDGAPSKEDERPIAQRILDLLALGPRTKNAICEALGRSHADIEKAISTLFAGRAIVATEVVVRGTSRKAFAVRSGASTSFGGSPDCSPDSTVTRRDTRRTPDENGGAS